jgi:hypothetical protein
MLRHSQRRRAAELKRHGQAASSGSKTKAPGSAGGYLLIGASKGIGLETTRQALEAGHSVRAFARSAADIRISDPKLEKFGAMR